MSINLYLDDKKVRNLSGFSDQPYKSGGGGGIRFKHLGLFQDKGRLYAMLNDIDKTPEELEQFVTDVSMQENFGGPSIARRELGVYEENGCTAELSIVRSAKEDHYHVKATGKNLDATRALIRKIKAGTIRPTESHQGGQSGLSKVELEEKFDQALRDAKATSERLVEMVLNLQELDSRKRKLLVFLANLHCSHRWYYPWVSKTRIADQITMIVNGAPEEVNK